MSQASAESSVHVSLRVPADLLADLDRVAAAMDRSRLWVIQRALRHYLAAEGAEVMDTSEGLAELRRERGFRRDHDGAARGDRPG
jgi:predicted transcriptional regulator